MFLCVCAVRKCAAIHPPSPPPTFGRRHAHLPAVLHPHMFPSTHVPTRKRARCVALLFYLSVFVLRHAGEQTGGSICGCCEEQCVTSGLRLGPEASGSGVGFNTCAEIRATCTAAGTPLCTQQTERGRALTLPGTTAEPRALVPDSIFCLESFSVDPKGLRCFLC